MKIEFWAIGKEHEPYVLVGVKDFSNRVSKYFRTEWRIIPVPRNAASLSGVELKKKEAEAILDLLEKDDYIVALDENGKQMTSEKLADFIQARANESTRKLIFIIGGAFGFHDSIISRANFSWSLSQLTFPHQLVRLILAEQVYRACSILKNEKYHHA